MSRKAHAEDGEAEAGVGTPDARLEVMNPSPRSRTRAPRPWSRRLGHLAVTPCFLATLAVTSACSSANSPETSSATSSERKDAVERLDSSTRLIADFRGQVPDAVAREARCVIAIPALVQGGLVVGGSGGRGFAGCLKKGAEWSEPAPISVSGASFGAQIGVQTVDVLMLVMNDEAKAAFLDGHFRVGVDASASAGPVGDRDEPGLQGGKRSRLVRPIQGPLCRRDVQRRHGLAGRRRHAGPLRRPPRAALLLQGPMPSPGASADRFVAALRNGFGPGVPNATAEPGPDDRLGRR